MGTFIIKIGEQLHDHEKQTDLQRSCHDNGQHVDDALVYRVMGEFANDLKCNDDQCRTRDEGRGNKARAKQGGVPEGSGTVGRKKKGGDGVDGKRPGDG